MLTKNELSSTMQLVQVNMQPIIDYYDKFDDERKGEISKLVNGLYGRVQAIQFELMTAGMAIKKGRPIILQTHADVTVGEADAWFAKSIECKSVTTAISSNVNAQLRAALGQVAGDTGHMPRPGDARVIEIKIDHEMNPWPFPGGPKQRPVETQIKFVEEARKRFEEENNNNNLKLWLQGGGVAANEDVRRAGLLVGSRSTRPVVIRSGIAGPQAAKVRAVTIKVRYEQPFEIKCVTPNTREFISEIVFQDYYKNNIEVFETVKLKKYVLDIPSNKATLDRTMV
jgi:hypothetical protein